MIRIITGDPVHDRPAKPTTDELRHDLESVHGSLLRLERTAATPQAAGAFHAAAQLVSDLLWRGAVA